MWQMGDLRVSLILESAVWVDGGGAFGLVPRVMWGKYLAYDVDNRVPMNQHCLLIQRHGQNILVDTGYGSKGGAQERLRETYTQPRGTLLEALGRAGLAAADINIVINTHLHNDHCGGNTFLDSNGRIQPTFPNAQYITQRREYEDAMRPNERTRATYLPSNYAPLVESGQMRLLDGDTDIVPGVRGVITPGHTPAHMSVLLNADPVVSAQQTLFVCDMASYAIHFERLGWMTAYDVEPLITLESKRRWQKWALETGGLLIFPHDTVHPAGHLVAVQEGKARVEAVEVDYL